MNSNQIVRTGSNSFADLQVRGSESGAMIRIKQNSEFSLSGRKFEKKKEIIAELKKGNAMFDLNKLPVDEDFHATSPTVVAAVRGTKYALQVQGDSTRVEVFDGSVAARPRIQALEDLPPEVRERSKVVNDALEELKKKEQVLEAGKATDVEAVELSPEVKKAVDEAEAASGLEDPARAEEVARKLDTALEGNKGAIDEGIQKYSAPPAENIADPELKEKLEEYNELIRLEKEKLKDESVKEAVQQRNAQNSGQLMRRIEKVFNKPSETLVLNNGGRVSGVVIQIGSVYYVYTVNGQLAYPESQVSGIEF
ncbi:MAG: FecR domain-containing protein [Leptospiraceae bacterium]|nr:FecR domain-containing protein [Leptospiraceae bacterium]